MSEPTTPPLLTLSKADWRLVALIVALLCIALLSHLHILPLRAEEPRRALVALEMELSGNYISPTINGVFYYNKPPVYNWLLILFYKITGSYNEWVVRLPSVFSLLLLGLLHFFIARKHIDEHTALLSALFFVTSADILFYFSLIGEIDLFYTLLVYVQIFGIFHFYRSGQYGRMFVFSYFMAALGLLTKGLPSLLFQAFTGLALLLSEKRCRLLFSPWHLLGIAVFLLVTGCYFYQYSQYNDVGLLLAKLLSESTERTVMEKGLFEQIQHVFLFPIMLLKILSPYILLLPLLFHKRMWEAVKSQPLLRFSVVFIVSNIWVYWLSPGTKDRYLYMFLPFCCTLLAYAWVHFQSAMPVFKKGVVNIIGLVLGILTVASLVSGFVPQTQAVPNIHLFAVIFALMFACLFYVWVKKRYSPMLLLVLAIVLLRMEFNTVIIPIQLPDFRENAVMSDLEKILEITQKQPVYLAGNEQTLHVETFGIGGMPLVSADLKQPPTMLFRISYYLAKETGQIMSFQTELEKGKYYLADKTFTENKPIKLLHEFYEPRNKINYALFQLE